MLDSIYIGMSGLVGYSRGLRVIANNTANINTPGFKGSSMQFGDLMYAGGDADGASYGGKPDQLGQGLATYAPSLDFSQGELRQTGNAMDLAVDGQGLFMLKDATGAVRYSRDGEFKFDDNGVLVGRTSGDQVLGRKDGGELGIVSLDGLRSHPAKATEVVSFRGDLSRNREVHTATDVLLLDSLGGEHRLSVKFTDEGDRVTGQWKVQVMDGEREVASGTLRFIGGVIDMSTAKLDFTYEAKGIEPMDVSLDFSSEVTSSASGSNAIAMASQDGYVAGSLTEAAFDASGILNLSYSNGQKAQGARLALARFDSIDTVVSVGENLFKPTDQAAWEEGTAGTGGFGEVRAGVIEISNVDLSSEFSDLVVMQRGYQASSQVVSTANDMLQQLFSLKGR